jgi:methionyl-tRNA synthetase
MEFMSSLSVFANVHPVILALVVLWSLIWKGIALWRAAHLDQKYWFGIILVVNTLGILEIVYLLVTNKKVQPTV